MAITSAAPIENGMIAVLCCVYTRTGGTFDDLIYNDPLAYADLVLNGNPEAYLKSVTEYKPLD